MLGRGPAADAEVRDAERLADRRLLRLALLRLLERNGRLRGHAALEVGAALLKEAVGRLAHCGREGKFSRTKSTGRVNPRVFPISVPRIGRVGSHAPSRAAAPPEGGPG